MPAIVRLYPRTHTVLMQSDDAATHVTTTFRANDGDEANRILGILGFMPVVWSYRGNYFEGHTQRRQSHVPKIARRA